MELLQGYEICTALVAGKKVRPVSRVISQDSANVACLEFNC